MLSDKTAAVWGMLVATAGFGVPAAAPSGAEVVYFSSGRSMAIVGHHVDGAEIVLELRGGGEIRCDPALIDRVELVSAPPRAASAGDADTSRANRALMERPFGGLIQQAAEAYGVNPSLVHALIEVESGYDAFAVSPRGAMGLMQLMPAIARKYSLEDPFDAAGNVDAGTRHLSRLIDRFGIGNALAAYNAGVSAVLRFDGLPPFPETDRYVERIMDLVDAHQD